MENDVADNPECALGAKKQREEVPLMFGPYAVEVRIAGKAGATGMGVRDKVGVAVKELIKAMIEFRLRGITLQEPTHGIAAIRRDLDCGAIR